MKPQFQTQPASNDEALLSELLRQPPAPTHYQQASHSDTPTTPLALSYPPDAITIALERYIEP